ncbi:MAG: alpha/beta hydrolase [Longimicrobiales bacterium]|nr:alpha/beta hydrolase [Longimicrobiales bacterium]
MTRESLPLAVEALGLPQHDGTDTFLLLHGYGGSSFSWRTWAPYLASRGHVLLVDMKGFGRAPKPDDHRYSPADQAALILRLIQERGLARLTLVGHSLGGGVALHVVLGLRDRREYHRLHRLIIVSGAAYMQPLPPFVALARRPRLSAALLRTLGADVVVAQALRSIVYDRSDITRAQIRGYAAPMMGPEAHGALLAAAQQIVPENLDVLVARYPEIDVPTLLLWGRHDRAVPLWVGQRLAAALPRSALCILERCGHLPAEERPEESLAALTEFLDAPS